MLRRILSVVSDVLRPAYAAAVGAGGCQRAKDGLGGEVNPEGADCWHLAEHIIGNETFYSRGGVLGMSENDLIQASGWVIQTRPRLMTGQVSTAGDRFLFDP